MKLAIVLMMALPIFLQAAERITTASISDVRTLVQNKKTEHGANGVLVVFDFDNTLMAMNSDLGSDQWYNWQSTALKADNRKEALFKDRAELFATLYKLFALIDMHAVEPQTEKVVRDIQDMGVKTMVHTSRGGDLRSDVEGELDRLGLNFRKSAIGPEGGYAGWFVPEGLTNARTVTFSDGILMGSGQNKGQLLKSILKKTGAEFKSIIFVDDTLKNIEDLEAEFKTERALTAVYYTYEEARVKKFQLDKTKAVKHWKKIKPAIDAMSQADDYKKIER